MTSTKVGNTSSRHTPAAHRQRSHSLAPQHLGEAASVAMVVIAVGGVALFIAGIAMAVAGLTMGSQFSGATPPPNLAGLGAGQLMGGFGLGLLGVALSASAAALLVDFRFSRPLAVGAAALTALLAAGGVALLGGATRKDPILLVALLLAVLTFGGSAAILARTRH